MLKEIFIAIRNMFIWISILIAVMLGTVLGTFAYDYYEASQKSELQKAVDRFENFYYELKG